MVDVCHIGIFTIWYGRPLHRPILGYPVSTIPSAWMTAMIPMMNGILAGPLGSDEEPKSPGGAPSPMPQLDGVDDDESSDLPPEAEHVIVIHREIGVPAPQVLEHDPETARELGLDEETASRGPVGGNRMVYYEAGDELGGTLGEKLWTPGDRNAGMNDRLALMSGPGWADERVDVPSRTEANGDWDASDAIDRWRRRYAENADDSGGGANANANANASRAAAPTTTDGGAGATTDDTQDAGTQAGPYGDPGTQAAPETQGDETGTGTETETLAERLPDDPADDPGDDDSDDRDDSPADPVGDVADRTCRGCGETFQRPQARASHERFCDAVDSTGDARGSPAEDTGAEGS